MKNKKTTKSILIVMILLLVLAILTPFLPYKILIDKEDSKYTRLDVHFSSMDGLILDEGQAYTNIFGKENDMHDYLEGNTPYKELNVFKTGLGGRFTLYGDFINNNDGKKVFYVEKWYPRGKNYIMLIDTNLWDEKIENIYFKSIIPGIVIIIFLIFTLFTLYPKKINLYDENIKKLNKILRILFLMLIILLIVLPNIPYKIPMHLKNSNYAELEVYMEKFPSNLVSELNDKKVYEYASKIDYKNIRKDSINIVGINTPNTKIKCTLGAISPFKYNYFRIYGNFEEGVDQDGMLTFNVKEWYPIKTYIAIKDTNVWEKYKVIYFCSIGCNIILLLIFICAKKICLKKIISK